MSFMERLSPGLIAALVLVAGFIAAVVLFSLGFTLFGVIAAGASIPLALVAWVMAGDRY
jgi:hypothetical protein